LKFTPYFYVSWIVNSNQTQKMTKKEQSNEGKEFPEYKVEGSARSSVSIEK
jgi:hypothetical protein